MKTPKVTYYYCCLLLLSLFYACAGGGPVKNEKGKTVFRYNEMAGITTLDPAGARSFENIWADNQLYNGLVQMDDSLHVQPCIARSWKISSDGCTYMFHLRKDVYFHDDASFPDGKGRRVKANDFVYSFLRLYNPKVSSAMSLLGDIDKSRHNGFYAPDDSTFVIYLKKPFMPFLGILTMKYFSVVPKEAVEHYGTDFGKHPVGTGPFKFKVWDIGTKLILVKNPHYFEVVKGHRLPYLDAVSISFIRDKETAFLEFMQDKLDMVSGIDAINTEEVLTPLGKIKPQYVNRFYLQSVPFLKTDYLGVLVDTSIAVAKNSPLKDKRVRQAINYGFNREKMIRYLRNNLGQAATEGFIPPGLPSYDANKIKGYDYAPDKARKLLAEAGYPEGRGLPVIPLHTSPEYKDICEYIQAQLQNIGIRMKIVVDEPAVLAEDVSESKISFFRKSWVGDYPDAEDFLSLFYSQNFCPNGFNYTHYSNPRFDALYEKALTEQRNKVRYKEYREMDQLLIDDAPVIPLYYDRVVRIVHRDVENLTSDPMNMLNLKMVQKTEKGE